MRCFGTPYHWCGVHIWPHVGLHLIIRVEDFNHMGLGFHEYSARVVGSIRSVEPHPLARHQGVNWRKLPVLPTTQVKTEVASRPVI